MCFIYSTTTQLNVWTHLTEFMFLVILRAFKSKLRLILECWKLVLETNKTFLKEFNTFIHQGQRHIKLIKGNSKHICMFVSKYFYFK